MRFQARHWRVRFSANRLLSESDEFALERTVPGTKVRRDGKIEVPYHGLLPFSRLREEVGIKTEIAESLCERPDPISWDEWCKYYREMDEVHDWVLDGFCTPFQIDAIEQTGMWGATHLWHPTGAGKTLSAILWSLGRSGNILVVTRAASRIQYGREFERFTKLRPYVVRPSAQRKKNSRTIEEYIEDQASQRCVVVVGWESITSNFKSLLAYAPDIVIFDESHKGKNTKRWEAIPLPKFDGDDFLAQERFYDKQAREARKMGGFIPDPNNPKYRKHTSGDERVMLVPTQNVSSCASQLSQQASYICCTTATPIKDRVRDLWGQLDLAEPKSWGTFNVWAARYCDAKPGRFGGLDTSGQSNLDELAERLALCTHKIDYRDTHRHLPAKRRQSVYIAPEDQCRPTAGFAAQLKAASKRGATAVLEVRIAQAASSKRRAIMSMVEDHLSSGHKVVIFSGRRKDVEDIGDRLKKLPIVKKQSLPIWAAHGGNDASERQEMVDQYMSSEVGCVLVGTGDSFGESLNMQDTDAAFFVMLPYTPGQLRQWEGRFCRLGQKRPVTIYYVIAESSVDEHIADILINKLPAVQKIVNDEELAEAQDTIAGLDNEDEIAASILAKI